MPEATPTITTSRNGSGAPSRSRGLTSPRWRIAHFEPLYLITAKLAWMPAWPAASMSGMFLPAKAAGTPVWPLWRTARGWVVVLLLLIGGISSFHTTVVFATSVGKPDESSGWLIRFAHADPRLLAHGD